MAQHKEFDLMGLVDWVLNSNMLNDEIKHRWGSHPHPNLRAVATSIDRINAFFDRLLKRGIGQSFIHKTSPLFAVSFG